MSKKVVIFSTYLLERNNNHLFGKGNVQVQPFQSSTIWDFFLNDSQTLAFCSNYFAMMDWKKRLHGMGLWQDIFISFYWLDELKAALSYYKDKDNRLITDYNKILKLSLLSSPNKEIIKQRIIDGGIFDSIECQGFAAGSIHLYWGWGDAPDLPLLHRRFSLYSLNNKANPDYATYAVWSLRYNVNNDVNTWRNVLLEEILKMNPDCEEIIIAIHDKDAGRIIPFEILEYKANYRRTDGTIVKYSVVLYDHANSRIHPLLRQSLTCEEVYVKISELIKAY